jgi:hypothetical protein
MASVNNQVTNRPTLVVDDKINDVADRSFVRLDGVAAKSLCAYHTLFLPAAFRRGPVCEFLEAQIISKRIANCH